MASITDGTSNTIMIGEKHIRITTTQWSSEDRTVYASTNGPNYRRFSGTGPGGEPYTLLNADDPEVGTNVHNRCFGSRHSGITNFTLGDASVRSVKNSTDIATLGKLAARDDGGVVTLD